MNKPLTQFFCCVVQFRILKGKEADPQSGGTALDTSVSLARWQQGEQTVAGVGGMFKYL